MPRKRVKPAEPAPPQETSIQQAVREYLTNGEYHEDLAQYTYRVTAYLYNREGRAVRITGRTFTDLENIHEDLGHAYVRPGTTGRFRLFVDIADPEGNKIKGGFVRVEDVAIQWDGEPTDLEGPEDPDDEPQRVSGSEQLQALQLQIRMKEMDQAHEMRMKEAELRSAEHVAALNAKSGGGLKVSDMRELIALGAGMARGALPAVDPGDGEDPEGGMGWIGEIAKVLVPPIVQQVLQNNGAPAAAPPAAAPPADAVVRVPSGDPRIPPRTIEPTP